MLAKNLLIRKKSQGLTLIELGIAVAIAIGIAVVALTVVPKLLSTSKADAEAQLLPSIATGIQKLYNTAPAFPTVATSTAASPGQIIADGLKLSVFPTEYINGAALQNRWGGDLTITATGTQAVIQYVDVPNRECAELAQALNGTFRNIAIAPQGTIGTPASITTTGPGNGDSTKTTTGQFDLTKMGTKGTNGRCSSDVDANTIAFSLSK